MGTDKRARQKELRSTRLEEARRQTEQASRRRRVFNIGGILIAAAVVVGVIVFFGGNDDQKVATKSSTTTGASQTTLPGQTTTSGNGLQPVALKGPGSGASVKGATPCPKPDGSSPRTTTFEKAPPMCIDPAKNYRARFDTTKGTFVVQLDAASAPLTVNNFVVLADYQFYNGVPFHRIVPNFVIQAGDPSDVPNGAGGPGYTIGEEPPADKTYEKYDLAMAKTNDPNSTGSQFFIVTGDPSALNSAGTYSLFGKVVEGNEVVDAIGATPTAGPSQDAPTEQVTINKVTIEES